LYAFSSGVRTGYIQFRPSTGFNINYLLFLAQKYYSCFISGICNYPDQDLIFFTYRYRWREGRKKEARIGAGTKDNGAWGILT
jgi:hypothetical protein